MKKRCIPICTALVIFSLLLSTGCASSPEAEAKTFSGTVSDISKYGNITTDIPSDALSAAGYELGDLLVAVVDDSFRIDAPYVSTYSDVDKGHYLMRDDEGFLALAINHGNFAQESGAQLGSKIRISLEEKSAYKASYEIRHLERSAERDDYDSDAIFANFREISSGSIAPGRLYRSCHPSNEEPRASYALSLVKEAGVKTIVNLADSPEALEAMLSPGSYYEDLYRNDRVIALNMGVDFNDPAFHEKLARGLRFMIHHEGPYLLHCKEGKDRAGMVSALLAALSGANLDEITSDYMESYKNYYKVEENDDRYPIIGRIIVDILKDMNKGIAVDKNTKLKAMAVSYLEDVIGLSGEEISQLQSNLR